MGFPISGLIPGIHPLIQVDDHRTEFSHGPCGGITQRPGGVTPTQTPPFPGHRQP